MEKKEKRVDILGTLRAIFWDGDDAVEDLTPEQNKEYLKLKSETQDIEKAYESALAFESDKQKVTQKEEKQEGVENKEPEVKKTHESLNVNREKKVSTHSKPKGYSNGAKHAKTKQDDRER